MKSDGPGWSSELPVLHFQLRLDTSIAALIIRSYSTPLAIVESSRSIRTDPAFSSRLIASLLVFLRLRDRDVQYEAQSPDNGMKRLDPRVPPTQRIDRSCSRRRNCFAMVPSGLR